MAQARSQRQAEEPMSFLAIGIGLAPPVGAGVLLLVRDGLTATALGVGASIVFGVLLLALTVAIIAWAVCGKRRVVGSVAFVVVSALCSAYPAYAFGSAVFSGSGATP